MRRVLARRYAGLALWDREAGRREAFAAAWWYEEREGLTAAEAAHWEGQAARLPEAMARYRAELPLPGLGRLAWVAAGKLAGLELKVEKLAALTEAEQEERLKGVFDDLNKASAPEDKERLEGGGELKSR
jgi:hypothetical protein